MSKTSDKNYFAFCCKKTNMYVCSISIFAIFCAFSHIELTAEACSQVNEIDISRKIEFAMRTNNYVELGEVLRQNVPNNMTLKKVQKIAKKMKSRSLHRAVRSTKSLFQSQNVRFSLTSGEFLQAALFIESQLPNFLKNNQYYLKNNQYYLKKEETSLACDLEYDLNRERAFLALPNNAENYLGKGGHKIVTKAILYDKNMPEVVANFSEHLDFNEVRHLHNLLNLSKVHSGHVAPHHRLNFQHRPITPFILIVHHHMENLQIH